MAHDGVADTVGLVFDAAKLENEVPRNDGSLKLERHLGRRQELVRRADVVQQTREIPRFVVVIPLGKMGLDNRGSYVNGAHL